jgi:hypothetical protein
MSVGLFENLLIRMVEGQPHTYRMIIS